MTRNPNSAPARRYHPSREGAAGPRFNSPPRLVIGPPWGSLLHFTATIAIHWLRPRCSALSSISPAKSVSSVSSVLCVCVSVVYLVASSGTTALVPAASRCYSSLPLGAGGMNDLLNHPIPIHISQSIHPCWPRHPRPHTPLATSSTHHHCSSQRHGTDGSSIQAAWLSPHMISTNKRFGRIVTI